MNYSFLNLYATHWKDLQRMVEENYALSNDNRTVLLGSCAIHSVEYQREVMKFDENVVYQLEPLVEGHWHTTECIIKNLEGAGEIWDYDLDNIQVLKEYDIDAKFRPCLYTESLKRIQNKQEPTIDVLFVGSSTPYRVQFINDLMKNEKIFREINASFVFGYNFFGEKLDNLMADSKIILNLNPYEGECRQQQTRIFYALINNKCVLSQRCSRNYFDDLIEEFNTYSEIQEKIIDLLKDDKWRRYPHEDYKQYSKKLRNRFNI